MNIIGFGTDIVEIERIKNLLIKNSKFKKRIFSSNEIKFCLKQRNKFHCFSKRFAAKEAFAKALGTGISNGINFNEIEVKKNKLNKPFIKLNGNSMKITCKLINDKKFKIFLSLSDEKKYALASVIIAK